MARKDETAATIDGQSGEVDPTPRRIDLKTLDHVKVEMARVYREMRFKKLESQDGTRLVYVLGQIGKIIELAEIERRLIDLEQKALTQGMNR